MDLLGIFIRRREADRPEVDIPLDTDRDRVIVEGSTTAPDPVRPGDVPSRPAEVQIAVTGLRGDWATEPFGLHMQISRQGGIPKGRQAVFADPYTIERPIAIAWGSVSELPGLNAEQAESADLYPLVD